MKDALKVVVVTSSLVGPAVSYLDPSGDEKRVPMKLNSLNGDWHSGPLPAGSKILRVTV